MSNCTEHSEITYVLFGREAVKLYKLSLRALVNSLDVDFTVGAYVSVKKFVEDSKQWDDFTEIPKEDFLLLRKAMTKKNHPKTKKKGFFSKLFR